MRNVLLVIMFLNAAFSIHAQNLFLNPSFEDAESPAKPEYWSFAIDPSLVCCGEGEYITDSPDALHGSDFIQLRCSSLEDEAEFPTWRGGSDILPNCRYRMSFSYRRSSSGIDRLVKLATTTSSPYGFFETVTYDDFDSDVTGETESVGTWHTHTKEFTTAPEGHYNKTWSFHFSAKESEAGDMNIGDVVQYDDLHLELLEVRKIAELTIQVFSNDAYIYKYNNTGVEIQFNNNSQAAEHYVEIIESPPPGLTANCLPEYWIITNLPGEFSAIPFFSYTDEALASSGIDETNITLVQKKGGRWIEIDSIIDHEDNHIRTENPISSFSNWAIIEKNTSSRWWTMYE